jgi:hypothetical protein
LIADEAELLTCMLSCTILSSLRRRGRNGARPASAVPNVAVAVAEPTPAPPESNDMVSNAKL